MLKNMTLGQYLPQKSFMHSLDPRTKLLLILAMIVVVFLVNTFWGYLALFAIIALGVFLAKISPAYMLKSLKPIWFIIAFTFVMNIFFYSYGQIIVQFWIVKITYEGLFQAVFLSLRLIFLVASTSLLTYTTSPIEFTDGLESLLKPLKKIKFPVHELALMMTIAIRFIPVLVEETDKIMSAQVARGANLEQGSIVSKIYNMVPILVPLFVSSFRRADELAQAMESRCYMGGEGRTRLKRLQYGLKDLLTLVFFAVCAVLIGIYL